MNKHDVLLARKCANDALDGDNPDAKVTALARRLNQALNSIDILKNQLECDRINWLNQRYGLDSEIRSLKAMLIVAAKIYGKDGEIELSESNFMIANTVHGTMLHRERDGATVIKWGREVLSMLFILCLLAQPCLADDEPLMYLQPHGPIPQMVLWSKGKPRRAIKRGAISGMIINIASNVVAICLRHR